MTGRTRKRLWRSARLASLAATLALLAALVVTPAPALEVLWKVVIPLVPASLLASPMLWRNVCPLSTLNMAADRALGSRLPPRRPLRGRWATASCVLGIGLLAAMVPARRFVFNHDGPALALVITGVAVAALLAGLAFEAKAGFCNAFCPVLPVERLYGQCPLIDVGNSRCGACTLCAPACIDLSPVKTIRQVLGPGRRSHAWLTTPFGAFAAAFPGFVLGYFLAPDTTLSGAIWVYIRILGWAALAWLAVALIVHALEITSARALPALAATAAGIYYWFAAPDLAQALSTPEPGAAVARVAFLSLVAIWLWRAESWGVFPTRGIRGSPTATTNRSG